MNSAPQFPRFSLKLCLEGAVEPGHRAERDHRLGNGIANESMNMRVKRGIINRPGSGQNLPKSTNAKSRNR